MNKLMTGKPNKLIGLVADRTVFKLVCQMSGNDVFSKTRVEKQILETELIDTNGESVHVFRDAAFENDS